MTKPEAVERARELAAIHEAIERGWNKWEAASCTDPLCGCVTGWIEREIEPVLAGALAAVRLEATASLRADCVELMAKWRAHGEAQDTQGLAFGVDGEDFRDCANDLEVALERAVEGKSSPIAKAIDK